MYMQAGMQLNNLSPAGMKSTDFSGRCVINEGNSRTFATANMLSQQDSPSYISVVHSSFTMQPASAISCGRSHEELESRLASLLDQAWGQWQVCCISQPSLH